MPIPVESSGCYMKIQFPNDIQMSGTSIYTYTGYEMMKPEQGSSPVLTEDDNLYTRFQGFATDNTQNYFIIKGCSGSGANLQMRVRVTGITSPSADKSTGLFKFDLYKDFNAGSYQLTN